MTDQQRLRDALGAAVPEPPRTGQWGTDSRHQARRTRRRRIGAVLVAAVVVALAVPGVHSLAHHPPEPAGRPIHGTGESACQQLTGPRRHGPYLDDVRVVSGTIAAAWLRSLGSAVGSKVDSDAYAEAHTVTVCVLHTREPATLVYLSRPGEPAQMVSRGGYADRQGPRSTMLALDRLDTGGAPTTDAPFTCGAAKTAQEPDVTASLPLGATAARICSDGGFYTPRQVLTEGVADLVQAVNRAPLSYSPPNYLCSPYAGAYTYTIVFDYPSGTRSVTWEPCRGMELGRFTRGGPMRLDRTFMTKLEEQHGAALQPGAAPECSASTSNRPAGVGDVREIVAARYCASGTDKSGSVLQEGQLRTLRTWGHGLMAGSTEPEGRCAPPAEGRARLQLADAWGNAFTMIVVRCMAYGHERYLGAVNDPGAPHRVTYPVTGMSDIGFTRLLRQLTLQP